MNNHDYITRPAEVLASWLDEYGYGKSRSFSNSETVLVYALLREREEGSGEWRNRWVIAGAAPDPSLSFKQAFTDLTERYKADSIAEKGEHSVKLLSLLAMAWGSGKWSVANEELGIDFAEWGDLTEQQKAMVGEIDDSFREQLAMGEVPVRMVNLITPEGLCAELTMYPEGGAEPSVEVLEQWSESESEDMPSSKGVIDDVLMHTFAFLQLIEAAVRNNKEMSMTGLLSTAMDFAKQGDDSMVSFLLRMVATAIDGGLIGFGSD